MKKSNISTFVIAITMIFTFANFNSAQTQREAQLGTLCQKYRDYNDCKEYLKDYPNGNTADFAKSIVDNYEANSNANSGAKTVEDKYWDLVKNSTKADGYKTYLNEYPNGKYASLARQKINGGNSDTSFLGFKVTNAMTNGAYMDRFENHLRSQLPIKLGEYEIYRADAPASVEDYFYTYVRAPSLTPQVDIRTQASSLKSKLLSDYCKSEAYQRKITVVLGFTFSNNDTYAAHLNPRDCGSTTTQRKAPVLMDLRLQTAIQPGANGRNRIPINRNDPANKISGEGILWNPAIYVDITFSDGTKNDPSEYEKKDFANNLVFDDVSGDPNDLIQVEYWDIDSNNPQAGKYAAQLASTGKGTGTAYLKVSLRDNPNVASSVKVEIISGANTTAMNGKIVFITSQSYDGNLGGVSGANATCQMHAKNAGLSGTFKAWLGDSRTNPWTSFNRSTLPYIMPNGAQIAANWQALLASNLETKFDIDEYGKTQLNAGAWTGLSEGRVIETCNNWTSNDSSQSGAHGCSSTKDSRWGRDNCGTNRCDQKYRLYCVQQ